MYTFFFYILFHYRLLHDIEYSSLCYTVGPRWLSILYVVVCICQSQPPNLPLPLPPHFPCLQLLCFSATLSGLNLWLLLPLRSSSSGSPPLPHHLGWVFLGSRLSSTTAPTPPSYKPFPEAGVVSYSSFYPQHPATGEVLHKC